jgi:hypothetical protein
MEPMIKTVGEIEPLRNNPFPVQFHDVPEDDHGWSSSDIDGERAGEAAVGRRTVYSACSQ